VGAHSQYDVDGSIFGHAQILYFSSNPQLIITHPPPSITALGEIREISFNGIFAFVGL
jgi:hypothetical protein